MFKAHYDCDGCGDITDIEYDDDGRTALPDGWIEVAVRRTSLNPDYADQIEAQESVLDMQTEMQVMVAESKGVKVSDDFRAAIREQVRPQIMLSSPVTATSLTDETAKVHFCPKPKCALKMVALLGGAVADLFSDEPDEPAEPEASAVPQ